MTPPAPGDCPGLVHDRLRQRHRPLDPFFSPSNIAVIGATEAVGSVGRTVLWNLITNPFGGRVFPVNPKRASVLGIKAYPSIDAVPASVDLAVIVTPAATVPTIVGACSAAGVPAAIVISAGFKELGAPGADLEREVLAAAGPRMRVIGPNCLGVMSPSSGLNATFAAAMARPGQIAFLSQSGALLTAILDWSLREQIGFSGFVSVGSMLDVGWGDLIDHFGDDPHTRAILIYMESVGDARAFLSAAREVSLSKPIIVIKPGRSEPAARAAVSHTGALTGSDEVLEAAFRRSGVLRVASIGELFSMAEVLDRQPRPSGPRLAIVTNAGGPGVLATDALVAGGGELAELSAETKQKLDLALPSAWSHNNPVDVLGDAGPDRYLAAVKSVADDPNADGLLVVLTPQDMTNPTLTAEQLRPFAHLPAKPVLASWMGGASVRAGVDILNRAGIATFDYPDAAAAAFCAMWRQSYALRALYQTPELRPGVEPDAATVADILTSARREGRTLLDEHDSKRVLAAYGVPVAATKVAADEDAAAAAAAELGYPVVCKLRSRVLTHKSELGGVKLDLRGPDDVVTAFRAIRAAALRAGGDRVFQGVTVQPMLMRSDESYELIAGLVTDPQFGPVILFGAGGQLVEVVRDRAVALPPLTTTLSRQLIEQTAIARALRGVRGRRPVDVTKIEDALVRLGRLAVEQPWISEIDINPLVASPDAVLALDARVVLHPATTPDAALIRPAVRPYPSRYADRWTAKDATPLLVRPLRPEDEPSVAAFHRRLSEQSVRMRYLRTLTLDQRTAHERLVRVCFADYDRDIPLAAELAGHDGEPARIVAIGRLSKRSRRGDAEYALLVEDEWQGRGVGTELLRRLVAIARDEGVRCITAEIMSDNTRMQRLAQRIGFRLTAHPDEPVVTAELAL